MMVSIQNWHPTVMNAVPVGLENSKTSKDNLKPTSKTYPFHLMFTIYMSFTLRPTRNESKEDFVIEKGRNYEITWEPDHPRLCKAEEGLRNIPEGEVHYQIG